MNSMLNGSDAYAGDAVPSLEAKIASSTPVLAEESVQHLVIIDSAVEDIDDLMVGVNARQVLLLNSQEDGVQQVSDILSQYQNLQSIEIVSHGNTATLQLGNTDDPCRSVKFV